MKFILIDHMDLEIQSLHSYYFQKSSVFLLPLLRMDEWCFQSRMKTFIAWDGVYTVNDKKLIAIANRYIQGEAFIDFENLDLRPCPQLFFIKHLSPDARLYVFDMEEFADDWNQFLQGRYSLFSKQSKEDILYYYRGENPFYNYIYSYLYPADFFETYARLLEVDEETLAANGELCNPFDAEKEVLYLG